MSTFLQLVQELHTEAGASGAAPPTVTSQVGEAARLVGWIKRADEYIQNLWENWKFLRAAYDENTSIGSTAMPVPSGTASFWDNKSFKIYDPTTNEPYPLDIVEYDTIKDEITDTTSTVPFRLVIMPDSTLIAEPVPDKVYRITGDVYLAPTLLTVDADVSSIPLRFHRAILGRALILYANYENAPEIKTQGQEIYSELIAKLQNNQLPNKFNSQFRTGGFFEVIGSQ